jgi:hypothetical protein
VPEVDNMVWKGEPSIVPLHLRRTSEDSILQKFCYRNHVKSSLLLAAGMAKFSCGEYAFFERIHPLGRFNFNDFYFLLDTIEDNVKDYVLIYKSKESGFGVVGWWINGASGKIWIDRQTLNIKKIEGVYNRGQNKYNQIQVDYLSLNGIIYPKSIQLGIIHNDQKGKGQKEKLYVDCELTFQKINNIPRQNYMKAKNKIPYRMSTVLSDFEYDPVYWSQYPCDRHKWMNCLSELSNENLNYVFEMGAKQKMWDKDCWGYDYYTGEYRESSLQFIKQMKKDLNLKY